MLEITSVGYIFHNNRFSTRAKTETMMGENVNSDGHAYDILVVLAENGTLRFNTPA